MAGHKFNPKHVLHLDNPLRKLFLSPEKIIKELAPESDDTWVDIGAGTGAFTIPLSRRVKRVYAVDISPEMLEHLNKKD